MALTETEEALLRELLAEKPELDSLADNEAAIISKLAGTKIALADLTAALSVNGTDLTLIVQDGTAKNATVGALVASIGTYGSAKIYGTYAAASADSHVAGDAVIVFGDAGTHTDPVVGGTVPNEGVYIYSASPAGLEWVAPVLSQSISDAVADAEAAALSATSSATSAELSLNLSLNASAGINYTVLADGLADTPVGEMFGYVDLATNRAYQYMNDGGVAVLLYELLTTASPLSSPETDKFITNLDGAVIQRLGDRMFVGAAVTNDGNFPNVVKDWYTTYEVAQGRPNGIIVSSQAAILTNDYFGAAVGLTIAAQTKNFITGVGGAVALEAHVVNNNTVTTHDAWAFYSEATRDADGVGAIITAELDARNKGLYYAIGPSNQHPKQSVVLQIASGAALSGVGVTDISAGINFRDNPTKMGAGIVFGVNAIRGTDGSTGTGNAMLLGPRHRITWTNLADAETGSIQSTITNVANNTRLEFSDLGALILGPTDNINLIVRPVANAENYWDMAANTAGNAPVLKATGSDTNIDLQIEPKGTGLLRFGNSTSMVANGTVATAMSALGPTGASTTVRKWLSVKDSAGTQLYIPCF